MRTENYTYILPGDYVLKDKHRRKLNIIANNSNMSNFQAQEVVDLHVEITEEFATEMIKKATDLTIATGIVSCLATAGVILTFITIF